MSKKEYVVRVVQTRADDGTPINEGGVIDAAFIESLRYAGLIVIHDVDPYGLTETCFDIKAPHGVNTKAWAEMNAERMRSFGFNAVCAPGT